MKNKKTKKVKKTIKSIIIIYKKKQKHNKITKERIWKKIEEEI